MGILISLTSQLSVVKTYILSNKLTNLYVSKLATTRNSNGDKALEQIHQRSSPRSKRNTQNSLSETPKDADYYNEEGKFSYN